MKRYVNLSRSMLLVVYNNHFNDTPWTLGPLILTIYDRLLYRCTGVFYKIIWTNWFKIPEL